MLTGEAPELARQVAELELYRHLLVTRLRFQQLSIAACLAPALQLMVDPDALGKIVVRRAKLGELEEHRPTEVQVAGRVVLLVAPRGHGMAQVAACTSSPGR